ncbi:hypothetical protein ACFJW7_14260 [Enterococcus faecalis]
MFGIESKFYRATIIIYKVVLTNFLFLFTSLLIVTIPASISALLYTLSGTDTAVVGKYFNHFKKSLIKTIPLGLFNLFSFLTMLSLVSDFQSKSLLLRLLLIICCSFLTIYNVGIYLIQNETTERNYFLIFRNSFVWTIMAFPKMFLAILGFILFFYTVELFFHNSLLLFGIGAIFYVFQLIFITSMKKFQGEAHV